MQALTPLSFLFVAASLLGQTATTPEQDPAVALAKQIAQEVSQFRALSWKREGDIASYDLAQLTTFVMKALDKELPDALSAKATRALRLLGLVPPAY